MSQSNSNEQFLVIDNGTQSVRALIFDAAGQLIAKSQITLDAYYSSQPGWAEQQPSYFWEQLGEACQKLWLMEGVDRKKIIAVSLTTQRGTVINVDANGEPLRPAILWLDQRLATEHPKLSWYWRLAFSAIRQMESIRYFRQKAQINWIKQHENEIWHKTHKYLLLSGYLSYKLVGQFVESTGAIVGYLPFNFKKQQWSSKRDWKWQLLDIKIDQLPDLKKPGETLGTITEEAHRHTGIPLGLKLIACGSDQASAVLGSGGITPNIGCLSFGTTATINTNNKKYIEPLSFVPPFPSAIPGEYNSEIMIYRGFWMIKWFIDQFAQTEVDQAKKEGITTEELLDNLIQRSPPGCQGLMLQPYWSPGLKNLEARGSIIGFGDIHTRAHIYRAILEGLIFALREGKESLERRQKQAITRIIVSGGGSQSDSAMQMTADIFNIPAERPHTFETSGLGAAMNIAVAMGVHSDYPEANNKMTRTGKIFYPNEEFVELYENIYTHLYLKLYPKLRPLYKKTRRFKKKYS